MTITFEKLEATKNPTGANPDASAAAMAEIHALRLQGNPMLDKESATGGSANDIIDAQLVIGGGRRGGGVYLNLGPQPLVPPPVHREPLCPAVVSEPPNRWQPYPHTATKMVPCWELQQQRRQIPQYQPQFQQPY
jgi:hypothetical protein